MNGTRLGVFDLLRNEHRQFTGRPFYFYEEVIAGALACPVRF
jgi:hypothetical protein